MRWAVIDAALMHMVLGRLVLPWLLRGIGAISGLAIAKFCSQGGVVQLHGCRAHNKTHNKTCGSI